LPFFDEAASFDTFSLFPPEFKRYSCVGGQVGMDGYTEIRRFESVSM
jgi:hypothetical protein